MYIRTWHYVRYGREARAYNVMPRINARIRAYVYIGALGKCDIWLILYIKVCVQSKIWPGYIQQRFIGPRSLNYCVAGIYFQCLINVTYGHFQKYRRFDSNTLIHLHLLPKTHHLPYNMQISLERKGSFLKTWHSYLLTL